MTNNITTLASVTADALNYDIEQARKSFRISKDAAGQAAAHAYIVWRRALAPEAPPEARNWIEAQINKVNERIDDDIKSAGAKSGYVRIKARDGASPFTVVVKFVLEFDRAEHSSNVSRYCSVLAWLHTQFSDADITDAGALIDAIKAEGGIEAILRKDSPAGSNEEEDSESVKQDEAQAKDFADFLRDRAVSLLNSQQSLATLTLPADDEDGWQLLVGRRSGATIDILHRFSSNDEGVYGSIGEHVLDALAPVDPAAEFATRLAALGTLIEHGQPSAFSETGNPHGKKVKTTCMLTMRRDADEAAELVYSAQFAKVSTVIIARPSAPALRASSFAEPVYLPMTDLVQMSKTLAGARRRLVHFSTETSPAGSGPHAGKCSLAWVMTNEVLESRGKENAQQKLNWLSLSDIASMPLDVELHNFSVTTTLDVVKVNAACTQLLSDYAKAKKGATPLSLSVCDGVMTLRAGTVAPVNIAEAAGKLNLNLRGKDLHDLLKVLAEQAVPKVELAIDAGGLIRVRWTEQCGDFAIHIPTANVDNTLEGRRIVPMAIAASTTLRDAA